MGKEKKSRKRLTKVELAEKIRGFFQTQPDNTFIYVKDLVQAVFLAIDKAKTGRAYFLTDGEVHQSSTFSNLIRAELDNPWWIRIKAPTPPHTFPFGDYRSAHHGDFRGFVV